MRKHIKYLKLAGTVSLLAALIIIGAVLNVSKSRASVGDVTLTVDSSDVPLGGRAIFTGSIPTGSSATALTSVTINLAPTTSAAVGLPTLSLTVDPTSPTSAAGIIYKKFDSTGCVTGNHNVSVVGSTLPASSLHTLTCTSTDVIASGSITGDGYVFVKIIPYLEGWSAGTLPAGTLPSALPGTLPGGAPSTSKIDYVVTWQPDMSRSPAPPALAASMSEGGTKIIGSSKLSADSIGNEQQTVSGGPANFPTFNMSGNAQCVGPTAPDCTALGMSIVNQNIYVLLDGNTGMNDVVATFQVVQDQWGSFTQFQGDFQIMDSMTMPGDNWVDFKEATGIARLGQSGNFIVVGGTTALNSYIAMVSPGGSIIDLTPANTSDGNVLYLKTLDTNDASAVSGYTDVMDAPPGGVAAYDTGVGGVYHIFVAEHETTTSNTAEIVKLTYSNASGLEFSKTVPIELTGNPGFAALAYDEINQTLIGSAPDLNNETNLVQVIYTGETVFADASGYIFESKTPTDDDGNEIVGELITGIGTFTDQFGTPGNVSDDLTQVTLLSSVYKDFWLSQMVAAVEVDSSGSGFFNQPHCVTQDDVNNVVYVCLEGRPGAGKGGGINAYELTPSGSYEPPSTDFEIGGTGEFSAKLEGGTYVAGKGVFVIDNQYPGNGDSPAIALVNVSDNFGNVDEWYGLPAFIDQLGGLTYDPSGNGSLIAVSSQNSQFYTFGIPATADNTNDIYPSKTTNLFQNSQNSFYWPEPGYTAIHLGKIENVDEYLLSRYEMVARVNPSTGEIKGGFKVPLNGEISGMGQGGMFAINQNWPGGKGKIKIASLPGETAQEPTIAEQYTNTFTVVDSDGTNSASTTVTFSKITTDDGLGLTITSPVEGTAFTSTDLVAGKIPIAGTVADPTITSISFGASLAKGTIIGSPVAAPTGALGLETETDRALVVTTQDNAKWYATGYWHVTDKSNTSGGNPFNDDFAFYFGRDPDSTPPSDTYTYGPEGTVTQGSLVTPQFTVGDETELTFETWWDTEPGLDWDQKLVQWCPGNTWSAASAACQTVLQITDQKQENMGGGGMGMGMMGPMMGPMMGQMMDMMGGMGGFQQQSFTNPGTIFSLQPMGKNWDAVFVPSYFYEEGPSVTEVTVNFDELLPGNVGNTGYIRFYFNTGDQWGNEMTGWYVDDVHIEGAKSAAGQTFSVSYNESAGTYGFSGELEANEGSNSMTLTATRLASVYGDGGATLTKAVTVTVFLDTTAPVIAFYNPNLGEITVGTSTVYVTNTTSFTVSGNYTENTPSALTVNLKTVTTKPASGNVDFRAVAAKAAFSGKAADFVSSGSTHLAENVDLQKSLGSTTLSVTSLAGATLIMPADTLNLTVGDIIKIDTVASAEYRDITDIDASTGELTLSSGLSLSHLAAVTIAEQPTIKVLDATVFSAAQFIAVGIGSKKETRRVTHIISTSNLLALENLDDSTKNSPQIAHVAFATGAEATCAADPADISGCTTQVVGAEDSRWRVPSTSPISLVEGYNQISVTMTDLGGSTSTAATSIVVLLDTTAPTTAKATAITVVSDGEAVIGDTFFLVVAAADDKSDVASVTLNSTSEELPTVGNVETILKETYSMNTVTAGGSTATTSHMLLQTVDAASFSVGDNTLTVTIKDTAGNSTSTTASLVVVSARSNRNHLLFPGVNYVGLALIPDDGDSDTTDDALISRALEQDITTTVSSEMQADPAFSSGVTLSDIITTVSSYSDAGNFLRYTPDASADTLTNLAPFQGMIFKVKETLTHSVNASTTYDVFNEVTVTGFTAAQAVPVKMNIQGVFFDPELPPPSKTLRVGYNLVAPHILSATTFDRVFRGALIPNELLTSAISFERRITPKVTTSGIGVEIFEGFTANSLGDTLDPSLAYWSFVVQDAAVNPTTPTITP